MVQLEMFASLCIGRNRKAIDTFLLDAMQANRWNLRMRDHCCQRLRGKSYSPLHSRHTLYRYVLLSYKYTNVSANSEFDLDCKHNQKILANRNGSRKPLDLKHSGQWAHSAQRALLNWTTLIGLASFSS
jgi:hypothetical protein